MRGLTCISIGGAVWPKKGRSLLWTTCLAVLLLAPSKSSRLTSLDPKHMSDTIALRKSAPRNEAKRIQFETVQEINFACALFVDSLASAVALSNWSSNLYPKTELGRRILRNKTTTYIYEYDDPLNGPVSCCVDGHSAMAVVEALENKWAGCGASGQAWWVKPFNGL